MDKCTLTKEIAERVLNIESYISYFEQMSCVRPEYPFGPILNSLQISIYIELFNLVDTNNSKEHNIYALFSKTDNEVEYQKRMSKYKKDIESIKRRRNDVIAHVSGQNGCEVFKEYPILNLKQMLQDIFDICYEIDPSVRRTKVEYTSMNNQFDLFIEKKCLKRGSKRLNNIYSGATGRYKTISKKNTDTEPDLDDEQTKVRAHS